VDLEKTATGQRGGWVASNLLRWREGLAEKLRGWSQVSATALSGVCRSLHYWVDLVSVMRTAAGTNTHLQVLQGTTIYDITPAHFIPGPVSSGTTPFSLLIWALDNFGEDLIAVPSGQGIFLWTPTNPPSRKAALIASGAILTGGFITPSIAPWQSVTNGGLSITINGVVVNLTGLDFATIQSQSDITTIIQNAIGSPAEVSATASSSGWQFIIETTRTSAAASLTYATPPATGTDISELIAWASDSALSLANGNSAPAHNQGAFVAMPEQIIMAFGCSPDGGAQDPMLVRWCDQSDYTDWQASATNQAGSFRLSRGNRIVGGLQAPIGAILWTDLDIWSVTYEGFPLVFGFFQVGSDCGLIAQKAAVVLGSIPYWMSPAGFFQLTSSGAQQIPCTVWDQVFLNLDAANQDKCIAGSDYLYNEVIWFYPSLNGGSGEIDSYVKYNVAENEWDYGPAAPGMANLMSRSAWTDQNKPGPRFSVDLSGLIQQQDSGLDANGAPMTGVMAQSGYLDIADGGQIMAVSRYIPDFKWEGTNPSLQLTLLFRRWSGDDDPEGSSVQGPFTITPSTRYVTFTARGREVAELITCDAADTWFRRGVPRIMAEPDGEY
jgi:hypothetical protein